MTNAKISESTNDYTIHPLEIIQQSNDTTQFGIEIRFERNSEGIMGILMNYHLMCATLVFVAAVNFLIDPKVVPGRAGFD